MPRCCGRLPRPWPKGAVLGEGSGIVRQYPGETKASDPDRLRSEPKSPTTPWSLCPHL